LPDLRNAWNDADAVAIALQKAGFSSIKVVHDPLTNTEIYDYVEDLSQRAGSNDEPAIIAFFFAGHGFQRNNVNYIAPRNVTEDDTSAAIPIESIIAPFTKRQAGMAIFFFDACRVESSVQIADKPGFGDPHSSEYSGTVQAFATQYNQTASSAVDEIATNSPYSSALKRYLPFSSTNFHLAKVLDKISIYVEEETLSKRPPQKPVWKPNNVSTSGFFFRPTAEEEIRDAELWRQILNTGSARCVREFKRSFPGSAYLKRAIEWLSLPQSLPSSQERSVCPLE